jgi:prepilin-type N-terminal cleavage/methylation domain-containing protein
MVDDSILVVRMRSEHIRGVTMIELLTAVAIIGIISGIVLVNFGSVREKSRIESAQTLLDTTRAAAMGCVYRRSNLNTPSNASMVCPESDIRWPTLPGGWVYGGGTCPTFDGSVTNDDTFTYCARGDGVVITCTSASCT